MRVTSEPGVKKCIYLLDVLSLSPAGSRDPDALGHGGATGWKGPESLNYHMEISYLPTRTPQLYSYVSQK